MVVSNANTSVFKESHSFEKRSTESLRIRSKYPDRIPVICDFKDEVLALIDNATPKVKYLVPNELTIGQFVYVIRKRLGIDSINSAQALFLFVNDSILPPTSATVSSVYAQHKDLDGFLYITVATEKTFGK
jgi:GABA(A) receptor-associated protein